MQGKGSQAYTRALSMESGPKLGVKHFPRESLSPFPWLITWADGLRTQAALTKGPQMFKQTNCYATATCPDTSNIDIYLVQLK